MKILKRAWISITRRKANSLILLLIVFILANVLLTTLSVTTSLKETKKSVLKQFPPIVTVNFNYENLANSTEVPPMNSQMAEELYGKTKNMVKSFDYSTSTSFTRTQGTKPSTMPSPDGFEDIYIDSLFTEGTQLSQTKLVAKGEAKLISGKGFSDEDIKEGKPKIIVSKQFAEANNLDVGSFLATERNLYEWEVSGGMATQGEAYFTEEIDLEVVGIIEIKSIEKFIKKQELKPTKSSNKFFQMQQLADVVYAPNAFINIIREDMNERIFEKYPDGAADSPGAVRPIFVTPEYVLNDMEDLDKFISVAKDVYNENDYIIESAAKEYSVIAKPLTTMEKLLDLIFQITVVASVVILTLVTCIFIYFRQKEMGIYLALGERRIKIVQQLLLETLIVAVVGATLAIFTSMIFSNMLSENTIQSLLAPSNQPEYAVYQPPVENRLTAEVISEQYQGGFSFMTIIVFYLTIVGTILISQIATALYLLRLNPKKILM